MLISTEVLHLILQTQLKREICKFCLIVLKYVRLKWFWTSPICFFGRLDKKLNLQWNNMFWSKKFWFNPKNLDQSKSISDMQHTRKTMHQFWKVFFELFSVYLHYFSVMLNTLFGLFNCRYEHDTDQMNIFQSETNIDIVKCLITIYMLGSRNGHND